MNVVDRIRHGLGGLGFDLSEVTDAEIEQGVMRLGSAAAASGVSAADLAAQVEAQVEAWVKLRAAHADPAPDSLDQETTP